jgi:hypothetical protein
LRVRPGKFTSLVNLPLRIFTTRTAVEGLAPLARILARRRPRS